MTRSLCPCAPDKKAEGRRRWGVQFWMPRKQRWIGPLSVGWVDLVAERALPPCVDYWPANWRTRREARAAARLMQTQAVRHSPDWQFRAVRLTISVRAG